MVESGSWCSGRVYTEGRGGPRNPRKWPNVGGTGTLKGKSLRGVRAGAAGPEEWEWRGISEAYQVVQKTPEGIQLKDATTDG